MRSDSKLREVSVRPTLLGLATERCAGADIPGGYCAAQRMWVVDTPSGPRPLIALAGQIAELQTKTKVEQESDDTADAAPLQLVTKTDVRTEQDDTSSWAGEASLITKTRVLQEEDRQDTTVLAAFAELTTKTHAEIEHDRQDRDEDSFGSTRLGLPKNAIMASADGSSPLAVRIRH